MTFVDEKKLRTFARAVRWNLSLIDTAEMPYPGFDFIPLAIGMLGASSDLVATTVKYNKSQASMRMANPIATATNGTWQKLSFAAGWIVAATILARMPTQEDKRSLRFYFCE